MAPHGTYDPNTGKVESVQLDEKITDPESDEAVQIPDGVSPMPGESPDPLAELLGDEEPEEPEDSEPEEPEDSEPEEPDDSSWDD